MMKRSWNVQLPGLALAVVSLASAAAAEPSSMTVKPGEPGDNEKQFLLRPFISLDELSLELSRGRESLSFVPNTQTAVGLRLGYAGFSLSASADVQASEDPRLYGKSEYLALQAGRPFRIAQRELFVSVFFQYHEGLYIENTSDVASGSLPILLPEMTVLSLGATAAYYLNPEFSYDATFVEFRPRAETIGSWTLRMSTGLMGFDNRGVPVIPESLRARFGAQGTLNASGALYVGGTGGYCFDLRLLERWFLAASLLVGVTLAREGHTTDLGTEQGTTLAPSVAFAVALGYAGDTLHAGLSASADLEGSKAGSAEQQIIRTAVTLFVGVRF
jgi:hypothetical protein